MLMYGCVSIYFFEQPKYFLIIFLLQHFKVRNIKWTCTFEAYTAKYTLLIICLLDVDNAMVLTGEAEEYCAFMQAASGYG